jgi:hypothetical protein
MDEPNSEHIKVNTLLLAFGIIIYLFFTNGFQYITDAKNIYIQSHAAYDLISLIVEIIVLPVGVFLISFIAGVILELLQAWLLESYKEKFNFVFSIGIAIFIIILFCILSLF